MAHQSGKASLNRGLLSLDGREGLEQNNCASSCETGGGDRKVNGGGGPESTGTGGNVEPVGQVWRGQIMDKSASEKQYPEVNLCFIGNQWSCSRTGLMCSVEEVWAVISAAEFCRSCSL